MNFHREKIVKQVKERRTARVDGHRGRLRERGALMGLWIIFMGHFFPLDTHGCPLAYHLALPGSGFVLGLSQAPPLCAWHLLAKMILVKRPMGRLTSLPFWSPRSLSAYTVRKIPLTSRMRKAWTLLSGQGSALLPLHLGASVDRGQTPGLSLGPICVLRQLGKSLNFSEPQFPFLYNGGDHYTS